jgi:hypothetical protein
MSASAVVTITAIDLATPHRAPRWPGFDLT